MTSILSLVGRVLLGSIFFFSGIGKITGWESTLGYMAMKNMPFPAFFLLGALFLEITGGLSLILGYKSKLGAIALIFFMIPTTFIFHDFWNLQGHEQLIQQIMFLKNFAIMGGLLMISAFGAGNFALDQTLCSKKLNYCK
jgi:putative oxidoreductase